MYKPSENPAENPPEVKQDPFFLLREVAYPVARTTIEDGMTALKNMLSREKTVDVFAKLSMASVQYGPNDDVY